MNLWQNRYHEGHEGKTRGSCIDVSYAFVKRKHGIGIGGPYVAVHLRRRDFLYSHKEEIPSLKGAAEQIEKALLRHNLTAVFVATDAPDEG